MRWNVAMERALYGSHGFFTRPGARGPVGHFRTSSTASPLFAEAITQLLLRVDAALGHPKHLDIVDIGAGRGELLVGLLTAMPPDLAARACLIAVERAPRPPGLPEMIRWEGTWPPTMTGLLLAVEWLDNIPLDIVTIDSDPDDPTQTPENNEPRYLLVDQSGYERLGPPIEPSDAAWLTRWWPLHEPGTKAEIGISRDKEWVHALSCLTQGLALAIDYGHFLGQRPPWGTLTGYRDGRQVQPVPDGTCDVTAHVAMDATAWAGEQITGQPSQITDQRSSLKALGVSGSRPPLSLATANPTAYLKMLAQASAAAELTDPVGLGGHLWLSQPVGIDWPKM